MSRRSPSDLEPWEETAFALGERWECPLSDSLLPARDGILPEPAASQVLKHLAGCRICQELSAALEAAASEAPRPLERVRLDSRIPGLRTRHLPLWLGAAAAVVVTVGGSFWIAQLPEFPPPTPGEPAQVSAGAPAGAVRAFVLTLEKPAIELPATGLVLRGSAVDPYVTALIGALGPFRRGEYADATSRLTALERQYPQKPHVPFYLGVATLLADRPADAIAPLQRARTLAAAGTSLHADATWYLAVALERQARRDETVGVLTALCGSGGARNDQACLALHRLLTPAAEGPSPRR